MDMDSFGGLAIGADGVSADTVPEYRAAMEQ